MNRTGVSSATHKTVGFNPSLLVENKSHGLGVFAAQNFVIGDRLAIFEAEFVEYPTRYTIQVDNRKHLVTEGNLGAFLNHSCDPNARFVAETLEIIAVKPIKKGEEVTFNYLSSEWEMASPFQCQCGSDDCHGSVQGFRHLSMDQKLQLADLALPYLRRLIPLQPWWMKDELAEDERGLLLDGKPVLELAQEHGTPLYVYSGKTIRKRLGELRSALQSTGSAYRMHYAMKANRFGPILALVRAEKDVGIDASSPREVALALQSGFRADEISVTCSMPSRKDLKLFAEYGIHLNLDTFSALRRWAATPGRNPNVGLRLDPGIALGYGDNPKLSYGNSKFGFSLAQAREAYVFAQDAGLVVDTLHVHVGWGLQQKIAGLLAHVFSQVAELARDLPTLKTINIGGGLCWKQASQDLPLAIGSWAELIKTHLAPLGLQIACESGTYVVASSGLLVTEINTLEQRFQQPWIGVDCGHNVNVYAAHYSIPQEIIAVTQPTAEIDAHYVVAGNINEANDIFARSCALPPMAEGDFLAFFPGGAYGASMASDHCLKGLPKEWLI
ncbi:MAG: SET domain-containing protein-lysine N-methyltransferase [Pseudobdellovibrionaceae bacterium]|nr:SET domain-containing protein-lysine N-methyltransferase [Pseudobdellovibrionaceae bacterium]